MSVKLIALGNILMKDDGIAVLIAQMLEEELRSMGIDVIYGETDAGLCLTRINEEDYLILLDAALLGKQAGDLTILSFRESTLKGFGFLPHNLSLTDLLKLYFKRPEGLVIAVEAADIGFGYGISPKLSQKAEEISEKVLDIIRNTILTSEGNDYR